MRGRSLKEAIIFLLLCKNNRRSPGTGKLENLSRWTSLIKEGKTYFQNKQRKKLDKFHAAFSSEKRGSFISMTAPPLLLFIFMFAAP